MRPDSMPATDIGPEIIHAILPHRYPFLLLDRVTALVPGRRAEGIKNVTISEPVFCGHFPGRPIVPGVLLVESLAQLTAVMYCSVYLPEKMLTGESGADEDALKEIAGHVGYLAEIRNMKFEGLVRPGDTVWLLAEKKAELDRLMQIRVKAAVGEKTVAEGVITVSRRTDNGQG